MAARQGRVNAARGWGLQHTNQTEADVRRRWEELRNHAALCRVPVPGG